MVKFISYCRVSTEKQGQSKLGLEAQRTAVSDYARINGGEIARAYVEVESGKLADRPELAKAIAHAKRLKARLVIAKLDRLARNVAFVSALMEAGVDFVAVDNPHANRLTIHILAAVAEDEARRISERTKAALAAAKARGTALGSARQGHWEGREQARLAGASKGNRRSAEVRGRNALEAVSDLVPMMRERRSAGDSLATIAETLNVEGHRTVKGGEWTATQVMRVLRRVQHA